MSTVQLIVNGVFIDLYEQDPIKLTYSIEDIQTTEAKSVFSRQFRVPATTHNYEFFKTAFEINGLDFDVTQKYEGIILDNGAEIIRGQFRMTKIFRSEKTGKIDYECLFLGETRSFGSAVGDKLIVDLDFNEYSHVFDIDTVIDSWQAYPEGGANDGIFDGDILYPLINFGNTYSDDGVPVYTDISGRPQGNPAGDHFTESGQALVASRFKPMIRAKVIWDKIFEAAGYTYSSQFLESDLFKKLYISAFGPEASLTVLDESIGTWKVKNNFTQAGLGVVPYDTFFFGQGLGFNTVTHEYTVPSSINGVTVPAGSTFTFGFSCTGAFQGDDFVGAQIQARLVKQSNGVISYPYQSNTESAAGNQSVNFYFGNSGINVSVNPGDKFWVEIFETGGGVDQAVIFPDGYFRVSNAIGGVQLSSNLKDDYKQIEFIKDIIAKFRLVMATDKLDRNNFIIEPWKDYIASGDYFDWTKKVDLNKDFVIEPLFFTQTEEIDFIDREDDDYLNELNIREFGEIFGTLMVDSQNELLKGKREIKTNIPPTPITQIQRGRYNNTDSANTFIIPHLYVVEPGTDPDYPRQNLFMNPHTRLLFYNGLKDTGLRTQSGNPGKEWFTTDGVTETGHTNYPMVSYYEQFPNTPNTLNLNWQLEPGYIQTFGSTAPNNPDVGVSCYTDYWSQYIESLYSKWARRVTIYIKLSSEDLRDFSFDDLIYIKDTYYYVEKIYDAPVGNEALVKVDLIKIETGISLNNPVVPPTPEEGTPWNSAPENYNEEDDFWQVR